MNNATARRSDDRGRAKVREGVREALEGEGGAKAETWEVMEWRRRGEDEEEGGGGGGGGGEEGEAEVMKKGRGRKKRKTGGVEGGGEWLEREKKKGKFISGID
ncbi:hypothetical protein Syun_009630 [Stephania yunnanensis]|uniref:Uncharacterized protein n=1 Tax=Stephania yunnanensis TaxID=152371 RepID=A0AAP0KEV5_9MAGN